MPDRLILASASPQRKQLLNGLGLSFDVIPSTVSEEQHTEKNPGKRAVDLAVLKAKNIAQKYDGAWVIGCDTLVLAHNGTLLEKPKDAEDARRMIAMQSGKTSVVHSGLCLQAPDGRSMHDLSSSSVHFAALTEEQIDWWVQTNLWSERSGAFQIDGLGQLMIERIEGDWTSIVGLPVFLLGTMMHAMNYSDQRMAPSEQR